MKQSQAFAAFRLSLITDKNHAIINELVPEFNIQCKSICERVEKDFNTYHNQAKADNFRRFLTYDLIMARDKQIEEVQTSMQKSIDERLAWDGASLRKDEITRANGKMKEVLTAVFPDGSTARVPQKLWIDYSLFERI